MRDWRQFVGARLDLAGLTAGREARLVREIAEQLEDLYRDAVLRGIPEEEADRLACQHVTDWRQFALDLAGTDPAASIPRLDRMADAAALRGSRLRPLWNALSGRRQDLRYAVRVLARRPGVAAVLMLTLALGIGGNSAIYAAVDAILLSPLPYAHAGRLVNLTEDNRARNLTHWEVTIPNWNDWRQQARVFEGSAAYFLQSATLTGGTEARHLLAARVSVDAFRVLGVVPVAGRDFLPEDASGADVVILSHRLWQQIFGGDAGVGKTLRLDGRPHTVVGVMPATFRFPSPETDLWRPMPGDLALTGRGRHFAHAIARLEPGVTLDEARRDLDRVASVLAAEYPDTNAGWTVGVESLQESIVAESRTLLLLAWAASGLVLLIACSNAAAILITETAARDREIAVRSALGAGRRQIVAQLLTEALLVASISGALGVGLAALGIRALTALMTGSVPLADRIALDWRVVLFTTLTVAVVAVAAGVVPALKASAGVSAAALKETGRTTRPGRRRSFRHAFVAGQVALALVLLIAAALIGRSLVNLWHSHTGFDPRGVITFAYTLPRSPDADRDSLVARHREVLAQLESVPGVQSAGLALVLPLEGEVEVRGFSIEGRPAAEMADAVVMARPVSAGFLGALRVPMLQGRPFTDFDRSDGEPVAIISRATAARYWPAQNPLGSRLTTARVTWRVVGVVEDVPTHGLDVAPAPVVYVPIAQWPDGLRSMSAIVRTAGSPVAAVGAIRAAVARANRDAPIFAVQSLDDLCNESISRQRFGTLILGIFAGVALVLAIVGIYGTVSNLVAQRTHEIGVRMAIGASPRDVLRATVGEGLLLAMIGVPVGVLGAAGAARLAGSLLVGVSQTDAATYAAMSGVLLAVVAAASWVPGRRALKIDPVAALRGD